MAGTVLVAFGCLKKGSDLALWLVYATPVAIEISNWKKKICSKCCKQKLKRPAVVYMQIESVIKTSRHSL